MHSDTLCEGQHCPKSKFNMLMFTNFNDEDRANGRRKTGEASVQF